MHRWGGPIPTHPSLQSPALQSEPSRQQGPPAPGQGECCAPGSLHPPHPAHLGTDVDSWGASRPGPTLTASKATATFCLSSSLSEATRGASLETHTFQAHGEAGPTARQGPGDTGEGRGVPKLVWACKSFSPKNGDRNCPRTACHGVCPPMKELSFPVASKSHPSLCGHDTLGAPKPDSSGLEALDRPHNCHCGRWCVCGGTRKAARGPDSTEGAGADPPTHPGPATSSRCPAVRAAATHGLSPGPGSGDPVHRHVLCPRGSCTWAPTQSCG